MLPVVTCLTEYIFANKEKCKLASSWCDRRLLRFLSQTYHHTGRPNDKKNSLLVIIIIGLVIFCEVAVCHLKLLDSIHFRIVLNMGVVVVVGTLSNNIVAKYGHVLWLSLILQRSSRWVAVFSRQWNWRPCPNWKSRRENSEGHRRAPSGEAVYMYSKVSLRFRLSTASTLPLLSLV